MLISQNCSQPQTGWVRLSYKLLPQLYLKIIETVFGRCCSLLAKLLPTFRTARIAHGAGNNNALHIAVTQATPRGFSLLVCCKHAHAWTSPSADLQLGEERVAFVKLPLTWIKLRNSSWPKWRVPTLGQQQNIHSKGSRGTPADLEPAFMTVKCWIMAQLHAATWEFRTLPAPQQLNFMQSGRDVRPQVHLTASAPRIMCRSEILRVF
jgi:hypothetical protein